MDPVEEVTLDIHWRHPMRPLKESWRGNCCGIKFEAITDGFYCVKCDEFFHKTCSEARAYIDHRPSNQCNRRLSIHKTSNFTNERCSLCREEILGDASCYECRTCHLKVHLDCGKYQPPKILKFPYGGYQHPLLLEMVAESCFTCAACKEDGDGYSYKCSGCDLKFHLNCKKYAAEVNHPSHSLHPLTLFKGEPPTYTDGRCRLCGKEIVDEVFYHCSVCNFSLDLQCFFHPPPYYHHDKSIHDHQLTLMPKLISFTCTICGLNGDRSPYICSQCEFICHNGCSGYPWVININRHDHRVSRTSLIGVVNSKCGVCQKKLDWTCGGYSCLRCPDSVFHTKCATRKDVWDGKEMKDEPEEDEDVEPFKAIDENTIQHFLHKHHHLRLNKADIFIEEMSCKACSYPIYEHSFYSCVECKFLIHESCANLPKRKRHMVSNIPYKLRKQSCNPNKCDACGVFYNGFTYCYGSEGSTYSFGSHGLDMRCASVSEPFIHQIHPHPLFYTSPQGVCSVCNEEAHHVLRCVEDSCGYIMDFKCALLPYEVKHRVDDHFLSLCYGDKDVSGKYWCDICEKETDPKTWFYTCKDCGVTLHTDCVLGDSRGLCPGSKVLRILRGTEIYEVVRNNSMSRPNCNECKSRCIFPVFFKDLENSGNEYYCSVKCSAIEIHAT